MKKHATLRKIKSKDQSGQMTALATGRSLIGAAMNAESFAGRLPGGMIQERTEALALALSTSAGSAIGLTLTKGDGNMIEVKNEVGEILLSGVVGDGWDENPITQKEVGKALKSFGNSPVTIRINSPGGSADEGIGIYNTILSHPGEVTTINDSLAASAASIIFLAGSKRLMADGSRLMIHRALGFAFGNQDELRKYIAALESYDRSLVDIYSKYMSESKENIEALLSAETWYEADAAIGAGLATGRVENGYKKKKPEKQMDAAKANLQRLAMAKYSQHLTRGK